MRRLLVSLLVFTVLGVSACGGDGSLVSDAKLAADQYVALDLGSGRIAGVGSDGEALAVDQRYQTTHVLFRRIPGGSGKIGCNGSLSDDNLRTVTYDEFFCAVHELTQAQWELFAGSAPWDDTLYNNAFADRTQVVGPRLPAWGMSHDDAAAAALTWARDEWRVVLPTSTQWEVACRAGVENKLFPWGNVYADTAIGKTQAVFAEAGDANALPRIVGQGRQPNAWGLYDLIGNIAELTAPEPNGVVQARGGAYDQPLVVCRASQVQEVPPTLGLGTVGVRLVLVRR